MPENEATKAHIDYYMSENKEKYMKLLQDVLFFISRLSTDICSDEIFVIIRGATIKETTANSRTVKKYWRNY